MRSISTGGVSYGVLFVLIMSCVTGDVGDTFMLNDFGVTISHICPENPDSIVSHNSWGFPPSCTIHART